MVYIIVHLSNNNSFGFHIHPHIGLLKQFEKQEQLTNYDMFYYEGVRIKWDDTVSKLKSKERIHIHAFRSLNSVIYVNKFEFKTPQILISQN